MYVSKILYVPYSREGYGYVAKKKKKGGGGGGGNG